MRTLAQILIPIIAFLGACTSDFKKETVIKRKQLFILVYDISKSNDSYAILLPGHFDKIYSYMGNKGGGKLFGLHIKTNSNKQEPFAITINSLDTLILKGNRIQLGHIRQKNKLLTEAFEAGRNSFVNNSASALIKDKIEKFSDVQSALLLVNQIVNMPEYTSWEKNILIVSDMENDHPPLNGIDMLNSMDFGTKVNLGVVRPSSRVDLKKVFPKLTVTNYSTIDDGIKSLINLNF